MNTTTTGIPQPKAFEERIFNFSAGPAVLPEPVLREAQRDLWNIDESGIGVLEHSHRGTVIDRVFEEAEADCRKLADIGDDHHVLFLQGGATLQFAMVPMCFLGGGGPADYIDTGSWSSKAIKEAKLFGDVHVAFEGKAGDYDHVPADDEIEASADPAYTYYCANNTIYGTEFPRPPRSAAPLVCDASSNIFSRPLHTQRHALVFAGAQKNLGPAGCTLVIIRKDFAERARDGLPLMLDYRQHAEKGSRLNTPPVFAVYVMGRVFRWILQQGGLEALARRNGEKARIIYETIEGSGGFYRPVARADSRSRMNITFRTPDPELDARFVREAAAEGMSGLKGHRSVGGLRASVYNAFPPQGCRALADFMSEFARRSG